MYMWTDETLRSYLSPPPSASGVPSSSSSSSAQEHNGVAPLELQLSDEQVAVSMKYWGDNKVRAIARVGSAA